VGAACRRDHLISRLQAAPTGIFAGNLDFPDMRFIKIEQRIVEKL